MVSTQHFAAPARSRPRGVGQVGVANAAVVAAELDWLEAAMSVRFAAYGTPAGPQPRATLRPPPPPPMDEARGPYADLVRDLGLEASDRLVLALAAAPYLAPERLDPFLLQNAATGRRFTEFGGLIGQSHTGFLPTAETAMFLLAGHRSSGRMAFDGLFGPGSPLVRRGIMLVDHRHPEEPPLSAALRVSPAGLHLLLHGPGYAPAPGPDFPATLIETALDWKDLVLDPATMRQVEMVGRWIAHAATLMNDWGLARRLKPGFRCLFHGGPGTGKTLTACLLGKRHKLPVYRVDLSRVVSKWIGETEKNLGALFDQAEDQNWVLFFDEAEALFGKRTESRSANDRSANQQIAYLLQRLEAHPGVAILATNQAAHMDDAFSRRFQSSILFPIPDAEARLRLWKETFRSDGFALAPGFTFDDLARRYELSGGAIINVLRYAALMAVQRDPPVVLPFDLQDGVRLELQKEGRFISR